MKLTTPSSREKAQDLPSPTPSAALYLKEVQTTHLLLGLDFGCLCSLCSENFRKQLLEILTAHLARKSCQTSLIAESAAGTRYLPVVFDSQQWSLELDAPQQKGSARVELGLPRESVKDHLVQLWPNYELELAALLVLAILLWAGVCSGAQGYYTVPGSTRAAAAS
mmetsp:Transcript_89282/g.158374  ORF Transcript_89282/g.158374 Transcript_89282/m.158374 type:complete len:166 (-) Transcript_89282:2468-2965(-)